ncbi:MAG: TonB-dependent receptor domain-containing protein, partial [Acidimicrobiales bacterium]
MADARGGVIAYVSRSGGPTMQGWVRAETDEPFAEGSSIGFNRFSGAVGGPFSPVRNLTWQVSATLLGQRSHYYGKAAADQPSYALGGIDTVVEVPGAAGFYPPVVLPRFVQASGECGQSGNGNTALGREIRDNYGFACSGLRRPMDWSTDWRAQAKLFYSYGAGSSVGLTLLTGEHQERFFPGAAVADAALYQGGRAWSRLAVANWGQRLGRFRGGLLHLHVNLSVGTDRLIVGALDAGSEAATRAPALGVQLGALRFTGLDVFPFPITDRTIRDIRTNSGLRGTPYFGRNDLETGQLGRLNPYGMATGWPTHGIGTTGLTLVDERRWSGKWALEWRPGTHRLAVGGDADRVELSFYESASLIQQIGLNAFSARPKRWGLFAGDRVELGGLVIDAGIRYDHYTPGAEFPKTPGRIASVDSATAPPNGRQWNPAGATDDTAYANSVARVFDVGRGQGTVSPRVRLLYAFTPRTNVRFSYGQQLEPPSFDQLLSNVNADLSFTSTSALFGRDVSYGKTALLELGGRHSFIPGLALDLSAYHKDELSHYAFRFVQFADPPIPGDSFFVRALRKVDGGSGWGIDGRLDLRRGSWLRGSLAYSLLTASPFGSADVTTHAVYTLMG